MGRASTLSPYLPELRSNFYLRALLLRWLRASKPQCCGVLQEDVKDFVSSQGGRGQEEVSYSRRNSGAEYARERQNDLVKYFYKLAL
jgi:hypothetical protein